MKPIDPDSLTQIVAIDGPAGAGKSTVAQQVARALGFSYLDTGAMYRAATWWAMHQHLPLDDPDALAESTRKMNLDMREQDGMLRVLVDGYDVTNEIRAPEVTRLIHKLDSNREIREQLVEWQRRFAARQPTVAEGRDIGTVVFPQARCKIFLVASLDERARRRAAELRDRGIPIELDAIRDEIRLRDQRNETRQESPLRQAEDAVLVDTTELKIDEVVERILIIARNRL